MTDKKQFFPAATRNRDIIGNYLMEKLPESPGCLLELGSGSGEHAAYITPRLKDWSWLPSDCDQQNLESIEAWRQETGCPRFASPLMIDLTEKDWYRSVNQPQIKVIFSANVIHIAPSDVWSNILKGAAAILPAGGILLFYGPFRIAGKHIAVSNEDFDQWLREKDADFGVRNWDEIMDFATTLGLSAKAPFAVPANNFIMRLEKP